MAPRSGASLRGDPRKFRESLVGELIAFAEHAFRLGVRQPDGATLREHLESVERQSGKRPPRLDGPEFPTELAYLLGWFNEIALGRQPGAMGPARLTFLDIDAWARLTHAPIEPWEVSVILRLDTAWLAVEYDTAAPKKERRKRG